MDWFNELCRKTTSPEIAARLLESRATIDVVQLLEQVKVPTLVLHSRNDDVVPIAEGQILAARIPGAQFVELDSKNHILLESEPAWERFCNEVLDFMDLKDDVAGEDPAFNSLTAREREVLAPITEGLGNAANCGASFDQREDGAQSSLESFRQTRSLDACAGNGVCT